VNRALAIVAGLLVAVALGGVMTLVLRPDGSSAPSTAGAQRPGPSTSTTSAASSMPPTTDPTPTPDIGGAPAGAAGTGAAPPAAAPPARPTPIVPVCQGASFRQVPGTTIGFALDPRPECLATQPTVRVFLVTYEIEADAVAHLSSSIDAILTGAAPTAEFPYSLPRNCSVMAFAGVGDVGIPESLAAPAPNVADSTLGAPTPFDNHWPSFRDLKPPC
jgi:hypothetical protein